MLEQILSSPFFGLVLTVFCWCSAVWLQKKTGLLVCNPVLVASLLGQQKLSDEEIGRLKQLILQMDQG